MSGQNTNETVKYEIPAEWDASIQAAERRGIRIGIEKMRKAAFEESWEIGVSEKELDEYEVRLKNRADKLLGEKEEA